jgi:hypothetical protein
MLKSTVNSPMWHKTYFSLVHYIIFPTSITLSITSGMFFFVFKFYLLQKLCSLNVLNMILETPNFKVTNIIFESYEHRSKIIPHINW